MTKSLLITDLDNTLFDWVDIWYRSFSAMFDKIVSLTNLNPTQLKSEIRQIHQYHGTSEYAFLLEEVPSLQAFLGNKDATDVFSEAIYAYRVERKNALRLYHTVLDTLANLKERGCIIVAYTESMAFYTNYRIRKLSLDGLIDILFSPEDHDLPKNLTRKYPPDNYELKCTIHKHTQRGAQKPSAYILHSIINSCNIPADKCVYVGDSLHKDIAMAKDAGIDHAWAKYGKAQDRPEYNLLREVTHWTDSDVQREKEIYRRIVEPEHVLNTHFSEILEIYKFDRKKKWTVR